MTTNDDTPEDDPHAAQRREHNPHTGRFQRDMKTVRRDAKAADLYADGRSYQQIADELGWGHKSDARKAVLRAKADVARPAVTRLIQTESEELDALYTEACAILQRNHVTVSHGRIVMWRNPETGVEEPLQDDAPKIAALRAALDVRKAYQDLHGLKQPSRVSVEAEQLGRDISRLLDATLGPDEDGDGDDPDA